jgi:hypothetical protein
VAEADEPPHGRGDDGGAVAHAPPGPPAPSVAAANVAILLTVGPFLYFQCIDRCQASEQDKNKNKNQGGASEDGPRSGFDILLLMVGGGVLLADMAVGACPESC